MHQGDGDDLPAAGPQWELWRRRVMERDEHIAALTQQVAFLQATPPPQAVIAAELAAVIATANKLRASLAHLRVEHDGLHQMMRRRDRKLRRLTDTIGQSIRRSTAAFRAWTRQRRAIAAAPSTRE